MLKIFLADLQNSFYRYIRNSVPIGMGYVTAYLDAQFGEAVDIQLFRKFEEIHAALENTEPDLIAFGSYSWNTLLTQKTVRYLRKRHPDVVIAVGGPDVSPNLATTERDIRDLPEADFFIANEGEAPMRNLVNALRERPRDQVLRHGVEGCWSVEPNTGLIVGSSIERFDGNLDEIPSPYLNGHMDRFLADADYLPIIQTSRGCPYRCSFCVSGKENWKKVKAFDSKRVFAEIDYIAERAANRYLRLADENFGILHQDIEIAQYIADKRESSGFPSAISIYTDKHPTDRVKQINLMLKDMMPFCISFQSMTTEVLDNIRRINLKDNIIEGAVGFSRDNDLMLVTELIFGLPGESIQSFLQSIDSLMDYRFESIFLNQLRILKGTEMDDTNYRKKYGFKTRFSMSENGLTQHSDMKNIEIDEWVVATNTMSEEEYFHFNKFIFLFYFGHYHGYLRDLMFLFEAHQIRSTAMFMHILDNPDRYSGLNDIAQQFYDGLKNFLKETVDEANDFVDDIIETKPNAPEGVYTLMERITVDVLINDRLIKLIDETVEAGLSLYTKTNAGEIPSDLVEEAQAVKKICEESFIPMHRRVAEEVVVNSPFDVAAWIGANCATPLSDYRQRNIVPTVLKIRNTTNYEDMWQSERENDIEKYLRNFAAINSHNRRRWVVRENA